MSFLTSGEPNKFGVTLSRVVNFTVNQSQFNHFQDLLRGEIQSTESTQEESKEIQLQQSTKPVVNGTERTAEAVASRAFNTDRHTTGRVIVESERA